jgi:hypothetical protein
MVDFAQAVEFWRVHGVSVGELKPEKHLAIGVDWVLLGCYFNMDQLQIIFVGKRQVHEGNFFLLVLGEVLLQPETGHAFFRFLVSILGLRACFLGLFFKKHIFEGKNWMKLKEIKKEK